jgi:hypothetical protein
MLVHIDWLSFTVKFTAGEGWDERDALAAALTEVLDLDDHFFDAVGTLEGWEWRAGRKPYSASFCRPDGGVAVFVHERLPHALIEVSGKGCETLGEHPAAADILHSITQRLTRIDLACDVLTEVRPLDFVAQRDAGRFKSHSEVVSESGETCYIGSRSSNRYARVYRYNPPHERAHLLRCEYVLKAEDAKLTAAAILNSDHYSVAAALGTQFGWQHPVWQVDAPSEVLLRSWRPDRREGKTVYWLADTIAPLLVRLHREGVIDAAQWFRENVSTKIDMSDNL